MSYLDILKTIGHHSDKHVNEYNDGEHVVGHEQVLADMLGEWLNVTLAHCVQRCQAKQRPEQRRVALQNSAPASTVEEKEKKGQNPRQLVK